MNEMITTNTGWSLSGVKESVVDVLDPVSLSLNLREQGVGLAIVFVMAFSQTGAAELTEAALSDFSAPFFLMFLHTAFMMLIPIPIAIFTGVTDLKTWMELPLLYNYLKLMVVFYPIWVCANYMYVRALDSTAAGIVTAVFGSCTAFVALFERVFLNVHFTVPRIVSVILACGGVVMVGVAAADKNSSATVGGVILSLGSSISAALYKVLFKKLLGSPGPINLAQFLFVLGVVNNLSLIVVFPLAAYGVEEKFWSPSDDAKWGAIIGGSFLTLVFNFSIALGISVTYPLFIAVGTVITIPTTMIVDKIAKGTNESALSVVGAIAVCVSFIILVTVVAPDTKTTEGNNGNSMFNVDDATTGTKDESVSKYGAAGKKNEPIEELHTAVI